MRRVLGAVVMGLLVVCGTGGQAGAAPPDDPAACAAPEVRYHLVRARTYHLWARATANSLRQHRAAEASLKRAKALAASLPPARGAACLAIAKAGLQQIIARKENAHDMFRNVFEPVWWLLGEDPTLERYDPDHIMLALLNAWGPLAQGILGPFRSGRYWVVARCQHPALQGKDPAAAMKLCQELRDEVLAHADAHPRLLAFTDEQGQRAAGAGWARLLAGKGLNKAPLAALARFTGSERVVVVDVHVADELAAAGALPPAVRLDLKAQIWDATRQQVVATVRAAGIGASLLDRKPFVSAWMGALLLVAVIVVVLGGLARARLRRPLAAGEAGAESPRPGANLARLLGLNIALGAAAYLLGGALGYAAGQVSGSFVPAWGEVSLSPGGGPRPSMMLWPVVHGAVVMLGPVVLCAYLSVRFLGQVASKLDLDLDMRTIIPAAQAGALGWLFAPLVLSLPGEGIHIAASLTGAGLLLGLATAWSIHRLLDPGVGVTRAGAAAAVGLLGLLGLLPVGFCLGQHLLASAGAALLALPVFLLSFRQADAALPAATDMHAPSATPALVDGADLGHPPFVPRDGASLDECARWLEAGGLRCAVVKGPRGIGKSRFVQELEARLTHRAMTATDGAATIGVGRACCQDPGTGRHGRGGAAMEPYALASEALRGLLNGGQVSTRHERMAQAQQLAEGVGKLMDGLPGFGMLPGAPAGEGMTRDMLVREVVVELKDRLDRGPVLLVLDDVQWADTSSLELLARVAESLRDGRLRVGPEKQLGIVLVHRPEMPAEHAELVARILDRESTLTVDLARLDPGQVTQLLTNMAVDLRSLPEDFAGNLADNCEGNPFGVLSFVRSLVEAGLLVRDEDGRVGPAPGAPPLSGAALLAAAPGDMMERQWHRMARLPEEQQHLLACAALCGRTFAISEVAQGLDLSRLEVIRVLHQLEDETGLVVDDDQWDDHFDFASEITREAQIQGMQRRYQSPRPELRKELHARIAYHLMEQAHAAPPSRVAHHCAMAGPRLADRCLEYAALAARQAVALCGWSEALDQVALGRAALSEVAPGAALAAADELRFLEAQALRGRGRGEDAIVAHQMLHQLVQEDPSPGHELLYAYLKCALDRPCEAWEEIEGLADTWLEDPGWGSPLERGLAGFYRLLARRNLGREGQVVRGLERLHDEVAMVEASGALVRQRDLLLSYLLQAWAGAIMWGPEADRQEVLSLMERSRELKERHADLEGLAINYGMRANYNLWKLEDPGEARTWLQRDLVLVNRMGSEAQLSSIHNRLGACDWLEAGTSRDAASEQLRSGAFRKATLAMELAVAADDRAQAAASVLEYGVKVGELEAAARAGEALAEARLWRDVNLPPSRARASSVVAAVRKGLADGELAHLTPEDWPWVATVLELLDEAPATS